MWSESLCPLGNKSSWNYYRQSQITSGFYIPLLWYAIDIFILFNCFEIELVLTGFGFQMFKQPLEEMADTEEDNSNGKNQALLNNTELKIIFGNLPPIYELHQ